MRALTLLQYLAHHSPNPFLGMINGNALGVVGASMGGQFTYYINGVDDRVKGAVAIAVAGDWRKVSFYEGEWLYHGLYWHTRDGLQSRTDALNAIYDICEDPLMQTFLDYFDPMSYAPTQHAPLLTIVGTHDEYFTLPAINTTYAAVASAGTSPRFIKRVMLSADGKHGVISGPESLADVALDIANWLAYSFGNRPTPPDTPSITRVVVAEGEEPRMDFRVSVTPGGGAITHVRLNWATQIDATPGTPCDFTSVELSPESGDYVGSVRIGASPPCGAPASPDNLLYFASVQDSTLYTITSLMYYQSSDSVMDFCTDFAPTLDHFPGDVFPVPPPPTFNCTCAMPQPVSQTIAGGTTLLCRR